MLSSENRHKEAEREKQQQVVHSIGTEDTAKKELTTAEYLMLRDDIDDLPKFTSNILDYPSWRSRFRRALDELDNSNPRKIIKWLEKEVYPALDREIQNLVDKETTVEGWLGRVDERFYSLDLIKSQVSALLRKLMDRQDIGKNSDNLYKMSEQLYNLEILLSTGDEIMAASHNEPNVYRNSAVNYDNTDLIIEHLPHRLREDIRKMIKPSMVKAYEHLAIITSVIRKEADERRSSERRLGHLKDRRNELFGKPPQKQPSRKAQVGERERHQLSWQQQKVAQQLRAQTPWENPGPSV